MALRKNKSNVVHFRLSDVEAEALKTACDAHGLKVSEALRRYARAIGGVGPTLDGEERALVKQLCEEIRRCGINLNQIAHAVNRGIVPTAEHANRVLTEFREAIDATQDCFLGLCSRVADDADNVLKLAAMSHG